MGMAAGQARLLSITSRMSDNELRAQIINNNKMRLATESSQVSESYVQALNEAQLMFTNYDQDNNASYQALTFNALTQYNPYNNQYALFNSAGNILVSESDAKKLKAANGDLNAFLKSYGLENTTTYWNNLKAHTEQITDPNDPNKTITKIKYKTGLTDKDGNESLGVVEYNGSADDAVADLQKRYEGYDKTHPGYLNAKSSATYNKYTTLVDDYVEKRTDFLAVIADNMAAQYESLTGNVIINNKNEAKTPSELASGLANEDTNTTAKAAAWLNGISDLIKNMKTYALNGSDNETLKDLQAMITNNSGTHKTDTYPSTDYKIEGNKLTLSDGDDKVFELTVNGSSYNITLYVEDSTSTDGATTTKTGSGSVTDGNDLSIKFDGTNFGSLPTTWDDKCMEIKIPKDIIAKLNNTGSPNPTGQIEIKQLNDIENMKEIGKSVLNALSQVIYNEWDPTHGDPAYSTFGPGCSVAEQTAAKIADSLNLTGQAKTDKIKEILAKQTLAKESFELAAKQLSEFLFGSPTPPIDKMELDNIEKTHDALKGNTGETKNLENEDVTWEQKFEKIYDVYVLDCIQNTYGEPSYAWIDTSKPQNIPVNKDDDTDTSYNENGQAKKVWYENLFLRAQQSGYQVLLDGLASSKEWIQFAFNSGIVSMEQIDAYNNWNPIIYSNCSDITEQTNNAAIAQAEAEYNAAMNKIENKDKRYDLELKNIDTEHNSLQTEYDSIKGAVDKNIERTFKMYS